MKINGPCNLKQRWVKANDEPRKWTDSFKIITRFQSQVFINILNKVINFIERQLAEAV